MNIVLGSTSPQKREVLQKALAGKLLTLGIESVEVGSGVSDSPLSVEETIQGATNRAKNALSTRPKANLAIGMEGGLENIGGIYNLVCAVAFWDGEKLTIGQSGHLQLPQVVSDKIKQGGDFGMLIREYQKTAPKEEEERIAQLISRELSFTSAINDALPRLGVGKVNTLTASATPQLQPSLIGPKLLKLAAVLSGFYFLAAPVILVYSSAWAKMDFYFQLSMLIPFSLLLTIIGISAILTLPTVRQSRELRHSLVIIDIASFLLLSVNVSLLVAINSIINNLNSFGAVGMLWTPIIYSIGLLVFGLLGYSLRQLGVYSIASMATIAYLLIGTIGITESYWILANLTGVSIFIIPVLLLGIPWCIGLWNLANELDSHLNPQGVNVAAFYKMDK